MSRTATGRLYEVDLLRIVAALSVVLYHYTFSAFLGNLSTVNFSTLSQITRYGYLGVDLFFVISGFVVLLSAWDRRPSDFVISRVVRLYPAFWVAVTITAIVSVTLGRGRFPVSPVQYLANLTMLNSLPDIRNVDVVYWTLWAELRFYLIVFVMALIGITRRRILTLLWVWLAATAVLETGILPGGAHRAADLLVQSQFSHYFMAGMALCLVYREGWSWTLAPVLALAYGNAVHRGIGFADDVGNRYHATISRAVVVCVITLIFVVLLLVALRVTSGLARPWMAVAGALTYPLYLVHAHFGFVLFGQWGNRVNRWVLLAGLVIGMCLLAYAIHALVERPLAPVLRQALSGRRRRTASSQRMPIPPAKNSGHE